MSKDRHGIGLMSSNECLRNIHAANVWGLDLLIYYLPRTLRNCVSYFWQSEFCCYFICGFPVDIRRQRRVALLKTVGCAKRPNRPSHSLASRKSIDDSVWFRFADRMAVRGFLAGRSIMFSLFGLLLEVRDGELSQGYNRGWCGVTNFIEFNLSHWIERNHDLTMADLGLPYDLKLP